MTEKRRYGVGSLEEEIRRMVASHGPAQAVNKFATKEKQQLNEELKMQEEQADELVESFMRDVEAFIKAGSALIDYRKTVLKDPKRQKVFDRKYAQARKAIERAQKVVDDWDTAMELDQVTKY